jgi:YggT family protein
MAALLYLLDTLLSLAQLAVLLRLLLQWARAYFRNPLVRALVELPTRRCCRCPLSCRPWA